MKSNLTVKIIVLTFCTLLLDVRIGHCQKDTIKLGVFITSLYDFDLNQNSFKCDFWLWSVYKNQKMDFAKQVEVTNTKNIGFDFTKVDKLNGFYWYSSKVKAEIRKQWDVKAFPFDKQNLEITIESSENDSSMVVFTCDSKNSKLNPTLYSTLKEWKVTKSHFFINKVVYNTNFGNPNISDRNVFPTFNVHIELERKNSFWVLFKLITGLLVAFLAAWCVFFIRPSNVEPRFGIIVGGLFAAIANKYIVEGIVPLTNELTLLDNIHNATFIYILLILILSIISVHIYEKRTVRSRKKSKLIDNISKVSILVFYILTLFYIFSHYLN